MPSRPSNAGSISPPSSLQGMELAIPSFRAFVERTAPIDRHKPLPPLPLQPRKGLASPLESALLLSNTRKPADVTCGHVPSRSAVKQGLSEKGDLADTSDLSVPTTSDVEDTVHDNVATTESKGGPYLLKPWVFRSRDDFRSSRSRKATTPIPNQCDYCDRSVLAPQARLDAAVGLNGSGAFNRSTTHPSASADGNTPAPDHAASPFREALRFCETWRNAMRGTLSSTFSENGMVAPADESPAESDDMVSMMSSPWYNDKFRGDASSSPSTNQSQEQYPHPSMIDARRDDEKSLDSSNSGEAQDGSLSHQSLLDEQCLISSSSRATRGEARREALSRHLENERSQMPPTYRSRSSDDLESSKSCAKPDLWSSREQSSDQIPPIVPPPYKTVGSGRFARIVRSADFDRLHASEQRTRLDSHTTSFEASKPPAGSTKPNHNHDIFPSVGLVALTMTRSTERDPQRQKRKVMHQMPLPLLPMTSAPSLASGPMTPELAIARSPAAASSFDTDSLSSEYSGSSGVRAVKQHQYAEKLQGPVKRVTGITKPMGNSFRSRPRINDEADASKPLPPCPTLKPNRTPRASPLSWSSRAGNALPPRRSSKKPPLMPIMWHSKSCTAQLDRPSDNSHETVGYSLPRRVSDAVWGVRSEGEAEKKAEKRRKDLKEAIRLVPPHNAT
nr:hypothetical protein CFP56_50427 [Quercus suber]